jgi:hypothetical protein
LCCQNHAIIFASDDKIFLPLIEKALRYSIAVYVESVQNLTMKELQVLQKIRDEAKGVLQIGHNYLYSGLFSKLKEKSSIPLDIDSHVSNPQISNLWVLFGLKSAACFSLIKSNIRKVSVNIFSSFGEVPDRMRIRIDFDNGSIGNIAISKFDLNVSHRIRVLGYDSLAEICVITHQLTYISSSNMHQPLTIDLFPYNKSNLYNSFDAFCSNIFGLNCSYNSIENEIKTQWVIERVKEKLRLSLNIF